MADEISVKKITELTSSTEADDNDLLAVGDSDGVLKKMTVKSFTDSTKENIIGDTDISNIADGTVTGAVSELNTSLSNLLSTQTITVDNISIDASGYLNSTVSCSRSGYTAVGIVGIRCENASTDGVGVTRVFVNRFYLSNATTITYRVTNYYTSSANIAITFTVLYTPSKL